MTVVRVLLSNHVTAADTSNIPPLSEWEKIEEVDDFRVGAAGELTVGTYNGVSRFYAPGQWLRVKSGEDGAEEDDDS